MANDGTIKIGVTLDTSKAEKEIKSMEKNIKNSFEDISDRAGKLGDKIGGALSGIGKIAMDVGKKIAIGIGAGITAFSALSVKALKMGGDLEQSIGGVNKIFQENADTVIANSKKAYETAGIDANTYMEQVTSFSASLLQSLGGDTAEAAKIADMAVLDMADNMNTYGTNIEDIQHAYQGFAKQNYTMLDNLKLGYGGTKTEMERLLVEAEKLSGVKYDISNLDDVYTAIHVIQEEMQITGTTAKEMSTTLNGAMIGAQAAFSNFLSGAGDADSFAQSFITLVDVVVDRVRELVPRLATGLMEIVQTVFSEFAGRLPEDIRGIFDNLPDIGQMINDKIASPEMVERLDTIKEKFANLFAGTDLSGTINTISLAFAELSLTIIDLTTTAIPPLLDFFIWIKDNMPIVTGAVAGVGAAFGAFKLITLVSQVATLVSSLGGLSGILATVGAALGAISLPVVAVAAAIGALVFIIIDLWNTNEEFRNNITTAWESIKSSVGSVIENIKTGFDSFIESLRKYGVLQEMKETFISAWESIEGAVKPIIEGIVDLVDGIIAAFSNLINVVDWKKFGDDMAKAWTVAWALISPIIDAYIAYTQMFGEVVGGTLSVIGKLLKGDFAGAWKSAEGIMESFKKACEKVFDSIIKTLAKFSGVSKEDFVKGVTIMKDKGIEKFNEMKEKIAEKLDAIKKAISDKVSEAKKTFETKLNEIKNAITNFDLAQAGRDLVQGLINGITEKIDGAVTAAKKLAQSVMGAITGKAGFDEHSPSVKGEIAGEYLSEGVAVGIEKGSKKAIKATEAMTDDIKYALDMGLITENEYYELLAGMRDKYLKEDSEAWRKANVEIHKFQQEQIKKTLEEEKKKNNELVKEAEQFAKDVSAQLVANYKEEQTLLTGVLSGVQAAYKDAYGNVTKEIEEAYEDIDISAEDAADKVKSITQNAYNDMGYIINDFFEESGIVSDETNSHLIDNIRNELMEYEDAHRKKMAMQQEAIMMANLEYDQETERIKAQIKAIDELTRSEDKAARAAQKQEKIQETIEKIASEEDYEKRVKLEKDLQKMYDEVERDALLEQREQEKQKLNEDLEAAAKSRKSKIDAAQEEMKKLEEDRGVFYKNELQALNDQYKKMTEAAILQSESQKALENKTQKELINILESYKSQFYKKGEDQGQAYYDGLKYWMDQASELMSISSSSSSGSGSYSMSAPAFATEGVANKPTLAIVGDTPDAEYMLREGTLTKLLRSAVSTTISKVIGARNQISTALSKEENNNETNVTVNQYFYEPQPSAYVLKRAGYEAGIEFGRGL